VWCAPDLSRRTEETVSDHCRPSLRPTHSRKTIPQCLWAVMHSRANEFQQSSFINYQGRLAPSRMAPPHPAHCSRRSKFFRCVYFPFFELRPLQDEISQTFSTNVQSLLFECFHYFWHCIDLRRPQVKISDFRSKNRNNVQIFSVFHREISFFSLKSLIFQFLVSKCSFSILFSVCLFHISPQFFSTCGGRKRHLRR